MTNNSSVFCHISEGFELYCVGVGKSFDKDKTSIKRMASKPIHNHTIKASYSSLNKTMPLLFKKLSLGKCDHI